MNGSQTGNTLAITQIETKLSEKLEDNRIGCMLSPEEDGPRVWRDADEFVRDVNEMGLKRVRLSIDFFDFNKVEWSEKTL